MSALGKSEITRFKFKFKRGGWNQISPIIYTIHSALCYGPSKGLLFHNQHFKVFTVNELYSEGVFVPFYENVAILYNEFDII